MPVLVPPYHVCEYCIWIFHAQRKETYEGNRHSFLQETRWAIKLKWMRCTHNLKQLFFFNPAPNLHLHTCMQQGIKTNLVGQKNMRDRFLQKGWMWLVFTTARRCSNIFQIPIWIILHELWFITMNWRVISRDLVYRYLDLHPVLAGIPVHK